MISSRVVLGMGDPLNILGNNGISKFYRFYYHIETDTNKLLIAFLSVCFKTRVELLIRKS